MIRNTSIVHEGHEGPRRALNLLRLLAILLMCVTAGAAWASDQAAPARAGQARGIMDQGGDSFRRGAFGDAIASYEAALRLYEDQSDRGGKCDALVMIARTSYFTGQYRKALQGLEAALVLAKELHDGRRTATVLDALGNIQIGMGDGGAALAYLNQATAMAKEAGYGDLLASAKNNLGNLYVAQDRYEEALAAHREASLLAEKNGDPVLAGLAAINAASAALQGGKHGEARQEADRGLERMRSVADSYAKAYGCINAALVYRDLRVHLPQERELLLKMSSAALREALAVAQRTGDQRSASYAYGHLARISEEEGQLEDALPLARRALFAAQRENATEALYMWHWESGRLLDRIGKTDEAIISYRLAIQYLKGIREEMSSCYANPGASYRRTASVICSELVDLLLRRASALKPGESDEPYLAEAQETVEALKVYELRDYFKDDCIDAARFAGKRLDAVSEKAAVIYPILFKDRTELLVRVAGRLKRFTIPVGAEKLTGETREFRSKLEKRTTWEFLPHSQRLYDWLVRPLERELEAAKPDTLVFVPDGPLRSIPMAALHDGKDFLISRYPVAVTPSLDLTDPRPMSRGEESRLLALGLTEPVQGFPGLPYVSDELKALNQIYGGKTLLNNQFRLAKVEEELKRAPFSIVHIASHGHFGGKADDTFLLAFDEKFTMNRFADYVGLFRFREEPLDMLTLSACETAAGDDRSALGLAGVAVRAGARSALATLWHVNDIASYELIVEFYRELRDPHVSRAAALQRSQIKMTNDLRYDHPGYWAPFLLINNWL